MISTIDPFIVHTHIHDDDSSMATKATASTAAAADDDGKAGPTAIGGLEMTETPVAPAASGSSSTTTSSSKAAPPSAGAGAKKGGAGRSVDMWAHNGLRGVAAVWIVVFHCYGLPKRSELSLNLQGACGIDRSINHHAGPACLRVPTHLRTQSIPFTKPSHAAHKKN